MSVERYKNVDMEDLKEQVKLQHLFKLRNKMNRKNVNFMNLNSEIMEGISIIHDQTNDKKYVQIALEKLEEYQSTFEDLFDAIIAESRKDDETISLEELKVRLQMSDKL